MFQDTILAAIQIALDVAHSELSEVEVIEEGFYFTVDYEFPEHRTGVSRKVRTAAKTVATVNCDSSGGGRFATAYQVQFKAPISKAAAVELKTAIEQRFATQLA